MRESNRRRAGERETERERGREGVTRGEGIGREASGEAAVAAVTQTPPVDPGGGGVRAPTEQPRVSWSLERRPGALRSRLNGQHQEQDIQARSG